MTARLPALALGAHDWEHQTLLLYFYEHITAQIAQGCFGAVAKARGHFLSAAQPFGAHRIAAHSARPPPTMTPHDWVVVCYVVGTFVVLACAAFAVFYTFFGRRRLARTTENFITARRSQPWWRIGWSFYAGAVGCWAVVTPASYASYAGIVGLVGYALSAGVPVG